MTHSTWTWKVSEQRCQRVPRDGEHFLQLLSEQIHINCVCGAQMNIRSPSNEYNSSSTSCDSCKLQNPQLTYHCPQKQNKYHPNGYDYCYMCATKQFKLQTINKYIQQKQNNNEENKNDDKYQQFLQFKERMELINFSKLLCRFDRTHCHLSSDSNNILSEYKKFLIIKCVGKDFNCKLYSPSAKVDMMWHLHVLDTKSYINDMNILLNNNNNLCIIHHDIDGGLDQNERNKRYMNTLNEYALLFKQEPNKKYWEGYNWNNNNAGNASFC